MIAPISTGWHAAARPGARVGGVVEAHAELGSTNDRARELLEAGAPEGIAVVAEHQTAGRGRRGRSWTSPPGVNLTVSVGLRPGLAAADAWRLGFAAALALDAVTSRHAPVALKWPNDLVAVRDGRKLAGLLVEVASEGERLRHAIVGIGMNVNWAPAELPAELAGSATSLAALTGRDVDRVELLRALLAALEEELTAVEAGRSPLDRYRARCVTLGERVRVETAGPGEAVEGLAEEIDDAGALVVRTDAGARMAVTSGDVVRLRPGSVG